VRPYKKLEDFINGLLFLAEPKQINRKRKERLNIKGKTEKPT